MHDNSSRRPRHPIRLLCVFFFLLLLGIAGFFVCKRHIDWQYTAVSSPESNQIVANPYQGFYRLRGYMLSDEYPDLEEQLRAPIEWDASYTLSLLEINLKNYRNIPLSDAALSQLDQIFSAWTASGKQLIVRFLYDWDGNSLESEPETLDMVLQHMEQAAPIVNRYADHIYILQGIFVGAYGEMHTSDYLQAEDMCTLIEYLASVTDPSIFLSVRTPWQWRVITGRMTLPEPFPSFDGTLTARLGLFNDGMLGSVYDLGTYGDCPAAQATEPNQKRTRADEIAFQDDLCRYVPNGGEAVLDNAYNDLENAVRDLSAMHVSYLNDAHDAAVLDKWKASVYHGDSVFDGCDGYTYIAAHLGFRYVLRASTVSFDTWRDREATFSFEIENTGFANSLRQFPVTITLYGEENGESFSFPCEFDTRTLLSGETQTCEVSLPLRALPAGTYSVYVQMADPAGGSIRFANEADADTRGSLLGTLRIQP